MTDCDTCGTPTETLALWALTIELPKLPPVAANVEVPNGRLLICNQCVAAMVNRDLRQVR